MKYFSFIPIRGGSKGLKNKNILKFDEKELYLYTVDQALRTSDKCFISTDIKSVISKKFNKKIEVFKRKKNLSGDEVLMKDVLFDFLSNSLFEESNIILLQATSPLRSDEDIIQCKKLFNTGKYSMVISVCNKNKVSTKYGFLKGGRFLPFFKNYLFNNRQNIPDIYGPNGAIYIFKSRDFLKYKNFPDRQIGAYLMPDDRSLDIDNKHDFQIAEKFFKKLK